MHPCTTKSEHRRMAGSNDRGLQCTIYELSMFLLRIPSEQDQVSHIKNIMSNLKCEEIFA